MEKTEKKFVRCAKIDKIAQILTVAEKPVLQTRILVRCSLSTKMTKQYLRQLLDTNLLECYSTENIKGLTGRKTKKRMVYQTSRKGKKFLKLYNELVALIQPNVERLPRTTGLSALLSLSLRQGEEADKPKPFDAAPQKPK